ncbi:MAG: hypothetical protein QOG35_690 [Solirubrobacteraceae bacterium]|jgi:hypothetical protein|nr:hypothetical protein [Solirubrobacteraceae bacterium]
MPMRAMLPILGHSRNTDSMIDSCRFGYGLERSDIQAGGRLRCAHEATAATRVATLRPSRRGLP